MRNLQTPRWGRFWCFVSVLAIAALNSNQILWAQRGGGGGGGSAPPPIQFTMELLTTPSWQPNFGVSSGPGMAKDINENGWIVGLEAAASPESFNQRAFVWTPSSQMVDLNSVLSQEDRAIWTLGEATAINDFNVVCGRGYNSIAGHSRGFRLDLDTGTIEELADDSGSFVSAEDLNNFNEVVGHTWENGLGRWGTYWSIDNQITIVDPGSNSPNGEVLSINDSGQMVGYRGPSGTGEKRALYWPDAAAAPIDLGFFAVGKDGYPEAKAFAINNNGVVVGGASAGKYKVQGSWYTARHAFAYSATTGMQDLGTLGAKNSEAWAINDRGDIVGTTDNGPFFYSQATGMLNLKSCIANFPSNLTNMYVVNINENREIVGNCTFKNDSRVWSIVLRPVNPQ